MRDGRSFPWARLRWVVLASVCVVLYGVIGYMALEGWSFIDAMYMTVITVTTVGFREVHELDTSGEVFTMTLAALGVGVALTGVSIVAAIIAAGELGGRARRRRMERRIEALQNHFIVCAYGRVGRAAVRELKASGLPLVVVDPKEELRDRMEADDVLYIVDDCSSEPVLRQAGVERAGGLICAVDSDATNVYIALTARSINPNLFIVARASEPGSAERLERAGANRVVSPFVSSGRHMVRMALDPGIVDLFDAGSRAERSIDVEERLIEAGSDLAGRTVAELPSPALAVKRADGRIETALDGTMPLGAGDVVLLLNEG